jgi:alkanesulfonate monooxygenase
MLTVYSTCPASDEGNTRDYRGWVQRVTSWTEEVGFRGMLVYNDNTLDDPWIIAQEIIQSSTRIVPLVAVQPVYATPFAVARVINTIAHIYQRQVDVNLVTGGFASQLATLGCQLEHDHRYDRLIEYGEVMNLLLTEDRPTSYAGVYYQLKAAGLKPALPSELAPRTFVSGSSPASQLAASRLNASRLAYPLRMSEYTDASIIRGTGMRVGIIARETTDEAWKIAFKRFPKDGAGERLHTYARKSTQSNWHRELSESATTSADSDAGYWLYPFRAYKTFCPYLIGDYAEVSALLSKYLSRGVTTLITDVPESRDDLLHARVAINLAQRAHALQER